MEKKLYRKSNGKMIAGVCAGLADYLNIDVTVVRLIVAALILCAGCGLLLYLIAWIVMPSDVFIVN
ncbi:MAG: PspC domain-containing protein [Candidatus Cryptobacteroides sp.]